LPAESPRRFTLIAAVLQNAFINRTTAQQTEAVSLVAAHGAVHIWHDPAEILPETLPKSSPFGILTAEINFTNKPGTIACGIAIRRNRPQERLAAYASAQTRLLPYNFSQRRLPEWMVLGNQTQKRTDGNQADGMRIQVGWSRVVGWQKGPIRFSGPPRGRT
jgi:hypothetical protein